MFIKLFPVDDFHFKDNIKVDVKCYYLHICIPGDLKDFENIVIEYCAKYSPKLVFIHSTVVPGTTTKINKKLESEISIHCPVHGKHQNNCMKRDMLRYPKYLGTPDNMTENLKEDAKRHFEKMGFTTVISQSNPETTEWAKILSTTLFGLQISFAQEVERICEKYNLNYDEVSHFFPIQASTREPIYPGFIGGHCVVNNLKIIKSIYKSDLLNWMERSNEEKKKR